MSTSKRKYCCSVKHDEVENYQRKMLRSLFVVVRLHQPLSCRWRSTRMTVRAKDLNSPQFLDIWIHPKPMYDDSPDLKRIYLIWTCPSQKLLKQLFKLYALPTNLWIWHCERFNRLESERSVDNFPILSMAAIKVLNSFYWKYSVYECSFQHYWRVITIL